MENQNMESQTMTQEGQQQGAGQCEGQELLFHFSFSSFVFYRCSAVGLQLSHSLIVFKRSTQERLW